MKAKGTTICCSVFPWHGGQSWINFLTLKKLIYLIHLQKEETMKSPKGLFTVLLMHDDTKGPTPRYGILLKIFQYFFNNTILYTGKNHL